MKVLLFTLINILLCFSLIAQPTPTFTTYASGFSSPVDIAAANDGTDRLFIVEKAGRIKIIDNTGTTLATDFLNISANVSSSGERGLLGLAFHPDYINNGYFYVNYTDNAGDTNISRFQVNSTNPNLANAGSEAVMIVIDQPFSNHNAGDLNFGSDGFLYIATGDGGSGNDPSCFAQNLTPLTGNQDLLGKMLRLDVNQNMNTAPYYGIPTGNPYVGNAGVQDEIWSLGLRNPWRFSFDRANGDLWIADVGQNAWEEVNYRPAGSLGNENYGWKIMEGTNCNSTMACTAPPACNAASLTDPIFEYGHNAAGGFSITGGYVYRGCEYPALQGYYICTDYASNNVWTVQSNGAFTAHGALTNSDDIVAFGEDEQGELYAASLSNGAIYRVGAGTFVSCSTCNVNENYTGMIASNTYEAANQITSNGTINAGSTVNFFANCIQLDAGFTVNSNVNFVADIIPCTPIVSEEDLSK